VFLEKSASLFTRGRGALNSNPAAPLNPRHWLHQNVALYNFYVKKHYFKIKKSTGAQ